MSFQELFSRPFGSKLSLERSEKSLSCIFFAIAQEKSSDFVDYFLER
jgi:hypothetical protein